MPVKAFSDDIGFDVYAATDGQHVLKDGVEYVEYDLGFAIEPPGGFYVSIRPRSSISNYDLLMPNSPATIDPAFRGSLVLRFKLTKYFADAKIYSVGDRIGQIVMEKIVDCGVFAWDDNLTPTKRGVGGFGSSGT